jgi:hypothetical protein
MSWKLGEKYLYHHAKDKSEEFCTFICKHIWKAVGISEAG